MRWADSTRLAGAEIRTLLRKIYDALPNDGALLVAEKLVDPTSVNAHMQNLNMLICTEGRERTAANMRIF